ncbi:TadE/TadG family type IV pilus assembly protein [Desulfofundulus thermosubterraneus]|uniref:TadE-like protein n=1 Tax=Desulfofundulus thermosubterraneus DSM 16057 TaxID=1121432 RepID=A0A1M6H1W3_9FIRM|nr:TadE/TadG family type IV pilus assembly protein [Desulfofundulus thermosubterraneus]SHJ16190.1 TadE-like protein [Desulfofundulus thermosubterraneus DSM 16057]
MRFLKSDRGSAPVIGFVILVPLLAVLIYGIAWLSHLGDVQNVVEEAARAGARWLASNPGDIEGAKQRAAEVVLGSFTVKKDIDLGDSLKNKLLGRLTKVGNKYYIGSNRVKPATEAVRQDMERLLNRVVLADGSWVEADVFEAKVVTTDPPETQMVQQQGGSSTGQPGTQGSQTVSQVRHPGPFPAAVLAQYGQGTWGTGWTSSTQTVFTNGALRLQVSSHYANAWSNPWSPPGGGKIKRIHIKGKSERNYDYGYVYGWNGSSWVELAKRCSPGYNQEYDEWIDVSGKNITQIRTRLTTDYSVLYSPTYVDVPEVEVESGASWPDPGAWWIWGQPGAGGCAPNGQEVTLTSPVWWTAGYSKYRLYATADDWFNVRVDATNVLQGSGQGVKTWDWEPGPSRPVQFAVTARNDYGPAGFLCSFKQTGWHWPTSYTPQSMSGGLVKYPEWTVPYAQWVTITAKDRYGRAVPVYVGTGTSGGSQIVSTGGAVRLQVNSHNVNAWSNPWSPPGGGKIKRIHIRGKSERNYDYGYVYGWNGSSWVELAKRCSPGYNQEYDEWIDVSGKNITQIKTRLTTDGSVLYSPTYVDVPEVEVEASGWVASGNGTLCFYAYPNTRYSVYVGASSSGGSSVQSTNGVLRLQVSYHRADVWSGTWSSSGRKIKRIHLKGNSERGWDYGYVYGYSSSSGWVLLAKESGTYDKWVDVSSQNITDIRTRLTTDGSVLWSPTYVDVPEVEVEAQSVQGYDVTVDLDGGVVLRSDSSWRYTPVDGVRYGTATLPQRVVPGAEFTVKISATNLARKEWFASRPSWWPNNWNSPDSWRTNFSYHWYNDKGSLVVQDGLRTGLPYNIPSGGTANLDLKVKAPSQPGRYRLVIDGVQEYCAWFGPLQGVNWPTLEAWIDVGGIDYSVSYDPVQVPEYMVAGETYTLQVRAENTGSLTWTPGGRFGLAYHWYDKNSGRVVVWDGTRDYVDYSVAPGQTYTFSLPVTAPPRPGTYILEIDMVREGVTWFKDRNCPTVRADVEVPQGDVLKGLLTYDGEDYWVGNTMVRSAGPDLSKYAGRKVILWGRNTGQKERFFRVTSIQEYFPGDWTAVTTFDPDKDVLCNDPSRGDPDAPMGDPVGQRRTDGYAYCRVTYHYPVPLRKFWEWASGKGMWKGSEPPSKSVTGEAFFVSGEGGD